MSKLARILFVLFLTFTPLLTFTSTTQAEPLQGLGVDVYTFDESALPDRQAYTLCASDTVWTSVANVSHDWAGGVVAGCQEDYVLIHYYGYITLDYSGEVYFQSLADDGFYLSIGDQVVIDNWWLKGCSGSGGVHVFEAGVSQRFDAWWYEYGGGACNVLYSSFDGVGWGVVPESAFTRDAVIPVEPPIVEPPIVEPPIVEPPVVEPPIVEPPIVEPPIVEPPVVVPPVIEPPVVEPPVIEPPVIEPEPTVLDLDLLAVDPQSLTEEDVELLLEDALNTFETAVEGSDEYNQALQQLMIVAQADDIVVAEEIAEIPVLGAAVVGLTNAINALGNFGADMSPKVREKAEKTVVSAVIVTQVATAAVSLSLSASVRRI